MTDHLKWGILATGRIAHQFAGGLRVSKTGELAAVGSRSMESARKFCSEHGGAPHGSYEAVLDDPRVDAVYIATPHHLHAEWTIKAAHAGKGVLCEKPFTLSLDEATKALDAVRKAGVFFMEAFMYRCHPQTLKAKELVESGALGEVKMVAAEFGFNASRDWDNFRLDGAVGGGALMDVGTYCVSFSRLMAGEEPVRASYFASITERGYDQTGSGALIFPSGINAHFGCAIHQHLENKARVYGTEGMLEIDTPWKCYESGAMRIVREGKVVLEWQLGCSNDQLYAYEADAVAQFWEGKECPYMSIDDTLGQARTLDMLKESAGLRFG
ncbi:MAG: Gfo/Idh/MocA family protein [Fimbriimonadales bacterium]